MHRDVKPENILYRTKEEDANVVLVDFGIARHLNDEDEVSLLLAYEGCHLDSQ